MKTPRNAFKTIKIKASSFASPEDLAKMTALYMELEAKKTDAVEAVRAYKTAKSKADILVAEVELTQLKLTTMAAGMENRIAREPNWLIYQDGADEKSLTFEGLSERLMRNTFRAQTAMMAKSVEGDDTMDGMFENEDED
jgi:hypothetical protein